jgi:AbrB family looped-hinge helix DNA binding protein
MGMPGGKKLYGTATIGSKGQVVIPADAREELNLQPGDRLYVIGTMHGSGVVLLKEEMLEHMMEQMSEQIAGFRAIKEQKDSEKQ